MYYLHNSTTALDDCLFSTKWNNAWFFADDGFGNFVSFGKDTLLQMFASTNDILSLTCAEREREEAKLPNIIE